MCMWIYIIHIRGNCLHNPAMKVKLKFINNDERPANWFSFKKWRFQIPQPTYNKSISIINSHFVFVLNSFNVWKSSSSATFSGFSFCYKTSGRKRISLLHWNSVDGATSKPKGSLQPFVSQNYDFAWHTIQDLEYQQITATAIIKQNAT